MQAERLSEAGERQDDGRLHPGLPCFAKQPAAALLAGPHDEGQEPLISAGVQAHRACSSREDAPVHDGVGPQEDPLTAHAAAGGQDEGSAADDSMDCVVCWEAEASVVFRPCGHFCTISLKEAAHARHCFCCCTDPHASSQHNHEPYEVVKADS